MLPAARQRQLRLVNQSVRTKTAWAIGSTRSDRDWSQKKLALRQRTPRLILGISHLIKEKTNSRLGLLLKRKSIVTMLTCDALTSECKPTRRSWRRGNQMSGVLMLERKR